MALREEVQSRDVRLDPLTAGQRSALMSRVRSKDTKPEMRVRRLVHGMGYRYRLHAKELPGRPDLVFRPRRKVIFVHGCFWHRHDGCRRATTPNTRTSYWEDKFRKNVARDRRNLLDLAELGWDAIVVWECETRDLERLAPQLARFLDGNARSD
ncbi:MAG: DNA mismatch endonuclease Vsr [Gammaproteobacteria bacterium]|nr:DNA mismatch endonuclease Vsr [Gammaproteobacteria bacterium]